MFKKEVKVNYFDMFVDQAEHFCKASDIIYELIKNFDTFDIPKTVENVHNVEHDADMVKRKLTEALSKEFLPPIEREDILSLANELDNVTDALEDILRNIYMYNVTKIRPEAIEFIVKARESCYALLETIKDFKDYKKSTGLRPKIVKVNDLESEGDLIYTEAIRTLFTTSNDSKDILVWMKIFDGIEACCDSCEHAADVIEMAVMKNS